MFGDVPSTFEDTFEAVESSNPQDWFQFFRISSLYFPHILPILCMVSNIVLPIVSGCFQGSNFSIDLPGGCYISYTHQGRFGREGQFPGKGWLCRGRSHHLYPRLRTAEAWLEEGKDGKSVWMYVIIWPLICDHKIYDQSMTYDQCLILISWLCVEP